MSTTTHHPPPAFTTVEDDVTYHSHSKSGEYLSSGMLKTFAQCPYQYHQLVSGQAAGKDSDAYRFGRAVHCIILEGQDAFAERYAIGGPVNPNTGKCYGVGTQKHNEWLLENGYSRDQVLNDSEAETLIQMLRARDRHSELCQYLTFGWPELVMRAGLHGVPCQIRMDWLTHDAGGSYAILDLKTTDNITFFESDARRYEYPRQFAFYRDVFQTTGIPVHFAVVALEKKEPYRVGIWNISTELLDEHSEKNRLSIELLKKCRQGDQWPTGYEEPRDFPLGAAI